MFEFLKNVLKIKKHYINLMFNCRLDIKFFKKHYINLIHTLN